MQNHNDMKRLSIILTMFFLIPVLTFGQTSKQKLQDANSCLDKKDYANSLKLFRELHSEVDRKDSLFAEIVYGLSASLFYNLQDIKKKDDWQKTIEFSTEFIKVLEDDNDFLEPG